MGNDERLITFYRGEGHDHKGRRLENIWRLRYFCLEHTTTIFSGCFLLRKWAVLTPLRLY
ncbi:hypothetical protein KO116_02366 [Halomonas sp. KO116]|nr:hypothetical protein KO116_02366 [Halomonas sp. KO116]